MGALLRPHKKKEELLMDDRTWFYTNSFEVRDRAAFEAFCQEHDLELFEEEGRFGCFHLVAGLPQILPDTSDEEAFLHKLAEHLKPGWVALVVDASITERDHCDCSWQITYAVNASGEIRSINPSSIFELAQVLGTHIAPLQDMWPKTEMGDKVADASPQEDTPMSRSKPVLVTPNAIVQDVADTLCRLLLDSLLPHARYRDTANLTALEREGLLRLGTLMRKHGMFPADTNDWLEELIRRLEEQESRERVRRFESFSTRCPYCGQENCITVIEVTLVQTGQTLQPDVPLQADGFDIYGFCDPDLKDSSTEDERVHCDECGAEFDLGDLLF